MPFVARIRPLTRPGRRRAESSSRVPNRGLLWGPVTAAAAKPASKPAIEPAIPLDSSRNLALSGLLLGAILLVRSPLVPIGSLTLWTLAGAAGVRLAFGDRVGVRTWWRGTSRMQWLLPFFVVGIQALSHGLFGALLFLVLFAVVVSSPQAPRGTRPLHPLHCVTQWSTYILFADLAIRSPRGPITYGSLVWFSFGGEPWSEFLLWTALVAAGAAVERGIRRMIRLWRTYREARDRALRLKLAPTSSSTRSTR